MANSNELRAGDLLIFQVESGYGVLRILDIERNSETLVWHVAAFRELFQDIDAIEAAVNDRDSLSVEIPHIALTDRAFESTQVSKIGNRPLDEADLKPYVVWKSGLERKVSDRSIRLALGLR